MLQFVDVCETFVEQMKDISVHPCVAFFSERGYRGFGQSSPSFAGSVTMSTFGRAVLH